MRHLAASARLVLAAATAGALVLVAACDNERTAESETPVSEAEVSTDLPETVLSDEQLQASADAAAQVAATPPGQVVAVPVPSGNATSTGDGTAAGKNAAVTANTTGR